MDISSIVIRLEQAWDINGFLGELREGRFVQATANDFIALLKEIGLDDDTPVPGRFVSLVWYIPSFLNWQKERIVENGGDGIEYERFVTQVHNVLEEALGAP